MKRFRSGSISPLKVDLDKRVSCNEVASEDVLECSWCEHRVHRGCTKISPNQCTVLNEIVDNVLFFCSPCMHKLPSALKCYDTTAELQAAIDSKLTAKESAFSNKFADHEAKFTKIVEDKLIDHEIKLNKMVEDFNSKHDNLLASKSDASESRLSKIAEGISLTLTNHCKQVETNLTCASSDNSMETASP